MLPFLAPLALSALVTIDKFPDCARGECFPVDAPSGTANKSVIWKNYTKYGTCACDVSNACDPFCCCDPDCHGLKFSHCLAETSPDDDLIEKPWALRQCSDPEDIERKGTIVDWFMRTMLCIYRDNNPVLGDFYEVVSKVGDLTSTEPATDEYLSFKNVFQSAPETGRVTPETELSLSTIRADANGNCVFGSMKYLESVSEQCSLDATCDAMRQVMVKYGLGGDVLLNWDVVMNCSWNEERTVCEPRVVSYADAAEVCAARTVNVNVRWVVNPDANPNSITKKGYEFGDEVETTTDGKMFSVYKPDAAGKCEKTGMQSVKFGDTMEVTCVLTEFINKTAQLSNMTQWTEPLAYLEAENQALRAAPTQPGLTNADIAVHVVEGYELPSNTTYSMLEGVIQQYTVWYQMVGAKSNPQKVIDHVDLQYLVVPTAFMTAPTASILYVNNSKLWTNVRFFEIPNNVNMRIASDVNLAAQAWLPF